MDIFEAAVARKSKPKVSKPAVQEKKSSADIFDFAAKKGNRYERSYDQPSISDYGKDVIQQGLKETGVGFLAAPGNLLSTLGLKRDEFTPGEQARIDQESEVFKGGRTPSFYELMAADDDDILPMYYRNPSDKEVRPALEAVGAPGEAKTTAGEYAGAAGHAFGTSFGLGGMINPLVSAGGAVAGKATEDITGSPYAALIADLLVSRKLSTKKALPQNQSLRNLEGKLKDLGYNEKQIAAAVSAVKNDKNIIRGATRSASTSDVLEGISEKSEKILEKTVPDLLRGSKDIHEEASKLYGDFLKKNASVKVSNIAPFENAVRDVQSKLKTASAINSDAKTFSNGLNNLLAELKKAPTVEKLIEIDKALNSIGKWGMERSVKNRLITQAKNGVMQSLESAPNGKALASGYGSVKKGIQNAYQKQEGLDVLGKAISTDGYEWDKMHRLLKNKDNVDALTTAFGPKSVENIRHISDLQKSIKNFDKAYKGVSAGLVEKGSGVAGMYHLLKGDLKTAGASLIPKTVRNVKGLYNQRKLMNPKVVLSDKMMTDPKFQTIQMRALNAMKSDSPALYARAVASMNRYLEEQGYQFKD